MILQNTKLKIILGLILLSITAFCQAPTCSSCLDETFVNTYYYGSQTLCNDNLCQSGSNPPPSGVPTCNSCLDESFVNNYYSGDQNVCFDALCVEEIPIDSNSSILIIIGGIIVVVLIFGRKLKMIYSNSMLKKVF
jgi:hypothetical protein